MLMKVNMRILNSAKFVPAIVVSNTCWNIVSVFEQIFEDKDILQRVIAADVVPSRRTRWRSWLRFLMMSLEFFIDMKLGSTQPLTEMSTTIISWGVKSAGAQGWQPYLLHLPIVLKSGSLNLLAPMGPTQAYTGFAIPFFNLLLQRSVGGVRSVIKK
jgi:hypothetical protein